MIFISGAIFLVPSLLCAHGVMGKVDTGGIVVTAQYDTGEPMSYAKVRISAPGVELSFQSGRTDRNGRFCFFPDASGDWKVVVDDELGHRLEVKVPVNEALTLQIKEQRGEAGPPSLSRVEKALIGISVIIGISGIFFWWKGKRRLNRQ
jgi:nickel transport protein